LHSCRNNLYKIISRTDRIDVLEYMCCTEMSRKLLVEPAGRECCILPAIADEDPMGLLS